MKITPQWLITLLFIITCLILVVCNELTELKKERDRSHRFEGYTEHLLRGEMFVVEPEDASAMGLTNYVQP